MNTVFSSLGYAVLSFVVMTNLTKSLSFALAASALAFVGAMVLLTVFDRNKTAAAI